MKNSKIKKELNLREQFTLAEAPIRVTKSLHQYINMSHVYFIDWYFFRFNALQKIEDENVAHIAKMTPIWEAEKAAVKAKEAREQLIQLAKDTGTPVSLFTSIDCWESRIK